VVYLDGAGATAAVVDAMAGVDPGVTDTLTEVLVAGNTSGGTNIELSTTDKVQFRDTGIYINSSVDGQLDIVADTEIQIAATTIDVNGTLAFDSLKGTGATTVTNILDEDNMASDSATAIATQQSIKAYVDSQVGSFDTLAEVLAQGNTTGGTDLAVSTGDDITFADNSKAIFGAGSDLQIYSDGTTGQVTGNVNVTGSVTADGLTVDGTTATIQDDSANLRFENSAGARTGYIQNRADAFEIWDDQATPMIFGTSNAERLRIDAAGNAGLGVTPEAWTAFNPVLRIKNASTGGGGALAGSGVDNFRMFANTYYDGAYKRLDTGFATQYGQESGQHVWSTAATGAGASTITWSESMRIDASGNVGIGTSSPQSTYKLTISGTDSVFPSVYLENTTNSKAYSMRATGTSWIIRDNTVGADRLNIDTSGNVGIGTDSPQEKTHSAGRILSTTQYGAPTQRIGTSIGENGNTRADIDFRRWTGAAANHGVGMIDVSDTGVMAFYTDTKTSNTPATTERMRIDASGNVGIGTDSPSAPLNVYNASNPYTKFEDAANYLNVGVITSNYGLINSSLPLSFQVNDTERMRIDASGNVGIGTSSPSQKLDVKVATDAKLLVQEGNTAGNVKMQAVNNAVSLNTNLEIAALNTQFFNGGTERMRIDSSGNVGIGHDGSYKLDVLNTTGNVVSARFTSTATSSTEYGPIIILTNDPNDTTRYLLAGGSPTTNRFVIYSNGNIQNQNNSYTGISDEKLKENIVDAGSQWDDIKALRVRKYSFKEENASEPTQIGVIAQEVEAAGMSGLVYETADQDTAEDGSFVDTGEVTKTMKYSILYMKAVKALQEAMDRIETLEAKVAALES
jgi:hypothetical protein